MNWNYLFMIIIIYFLFYTINTYFLESPNYYENFAVKNPKKNQNKNIKNQNQNQNTKVIIVEKENKISIPKNMFFDNLYKLEREYLTKPFPIKDTYKSIIPLHIYQTWYTKNLPPKMAECVESLKQDNPEFEHHLYDDLDCRNFIKNNFSEEILQTYDSLIPGAYRADLWRYCILYKK